MLNRLEIRKSRSAACLSDFSLDRLTLGDLDGSAEKARVSAHLAACGKCRTRLAEMEAVIAPALNFGETETAAEPQTSKPSRNWRTRALWFTPLFAAGAALALLLPWRTPGERSKGGGWQLGVVAQYPNGRISGVSQGAALAPGDRLRFEVSAPADAFVSVISLDAIGAVTAFSPATGSAAAVRAGQRRLLDDAVLLDDSLGPERLVLLACPRPVPVAEVVAAGRVALGQAQGRLDAIGDLALPCSQTSFWIQKEMRP